MIHSTCKKPVYTRQTEQIYSDGSSGKDFMWYCPSCCQDVYDVEPTNE